MWRLRVEGPERHSNSPDNQQTNKQELLISNIVTGNYLFHLKPGSWVSPPYHVSVYFTMDTLRIRVFSVSVVSVSRAPELSVVTTNDVTRIKIT